MFTNDRENEHVWWKFREGRIVGDKAGEKGRGQVNV